MNKTRKEADGGVTYTVQVGNPLRDVAYKKTGFKNTEQERKTTNHIVLFVT